MYAASDRGSSRFRSVVFLICALISTSLLARSWNTEASVTVRCFGQPLAGVQVDLMHSVDRWDTISDRVMDTKLTDDKGFAQLRGAGGSIWGPPAPYIRVVYRSTVGGPVAPAVVVSVKNEIGSVRSDHGDTRAFDWRPGVINMGIQNYKTVDCGIWMDADAALADYKSIVGDSANLPYSQLDIMRWSGIYSGTPFSLLQNIAWPTNYFSNYRSMLHEMSHTVRHSFDGDMSHFLKDAADYGYIRNHDETSDTNEGFAFNEGWGEFWEMRFRLPPPMMTFVNSPPKWTVEGDVAADLRRLTECVGFANMAMLLRDNPGAIHSRDEFLAIYKRRFKGACEPPAPPPPTPGGCASGTVSQQFYDGMVGCAGRVKAADAPKLCGTGFSLCTTTQYTLNRRHLKPEHNYWTADHLNLDGYLGNCAAVPWPKGSDCHDSALHVCVPIMPTGGTDPEGNTCRDDVNECYFDPAVGEEAPPNQYLGGCGFTDETAGAVCCAFPPTIAEAPAPVSDPRLKAHDREVLVRSIDDLLKQLASARQQAVMPASCPEQNCGPSLEPLIQPALIEGAIETNRAFLRHFDAAPPTMMDLQRNTEAWRKTMARNYVLEIVAIQRQALENAIKALDAALRTPMTKSAAEEAVTELRREIAELNDIAMHPEQPPANIRTEW
jgi:hypothetical protein